MTDRDLNLEFAVNAAFRKLIADPSVGWTGPEFEWESGNLRATTPEPHIAFDPQYIEDNDIEVDLEYVLRFFSAWYFDLGVRAVHRIRIYAGRISNLTS